MASRAGCPQKKHLGPLLVARRVKRRVSGSVTYIAYSSSTPRDVTGHVTSQRRRIGAGRGDGGGGRSGGSCGGSARIRWTVGGRGYSGAGWGGAGGADAHSPPLQRRVVRGWLRSGLVTARRPVTVRAGPTGFSAALKSKSTTRRGGWGRLPNG